MKVCCGCIFVVFLYISIQLLHFARVYTWNTCSTGDRFIIVITHFEVNSATGRPRTRYQFHLQYRVDFEVEVAVNLRPTVSRPVCPGVRRPSGTCDQFFFRHEISFRHLRFCYFVAPSLTRGRVCNLLLNCFWALPEQSLLSRSPAELTALFCCLIWDSPNLEGQVPVFISLRNRVAQLYPRALGCACE
jgi:hypothetical protein